MFLSPSKAHLILDFSFQISSSKERSWSKSRRVCLSWSARRSLWAELSMIFYAPSNLALAILILSCTFPKTDLFQSLSFLLRILSFLFKINMEHPITLVSQLSKITLLQPLWRLHILENLKGDGSLILLAITCKRRGKWFDLGLVRVEKEMEEQASIRLKL